MELFDEDFKVNEKTDNKKTLTIIMVLIIFFIIMVLLVIGAMIYIKQTTLTVTLDGQESTTIKSMIKIDENDPQNVYVPIRKIAKLLKYNDYSGNYITKSEEENQCYVECEDEVAMFTLNSNVIYKIIKNGNNNYEDYVISSDNKDAVKSIDGELCTTIDGIEKAFNVSWNYDIENKKMKIYTMPYLIEFYNKKAVSLGYSGSSEDFNNKKAVLEGMLIVEKENSNNTKYAVLDLSTENLILEPKYEEIEYLVHTNDFLVTSENKKGIISKQKRTIVKLQYDDIELMDYHKRLYLVENSNAYGIIDFDGKKVLEIEYDEIGVDISKFEENEIRNRFVIADTLIPVKKNDLWGFVDVKGKQITEFKYDSIGYITTNNKAGSGYNLLIVPEYNVIVVGLEDKYTVINLNGKEIWGLVFDGMYMYIDKGETSYLMEYDSKTYNLTEQLDKIGYGKKQYTIDNDDKEQEESQSEEQEESNNNQSQRNDEEDNSQDNNEEDDGEDNNNGEDDNGEEDDGEDDDDGEGIVLMQRIAIVLNV